MDVTIETSVSIPKILFDQAEVLAQQLHISQAALFESAIENFIRKHQNSTPPDANLGGARRIINQGDIYWVALENPGALEPAILHPYVVVQDNVFNHSRIHTVVACALTSNIRRMSDTPGNVLLEVGEANLPKQSVVEVSKVSTVEKTQLGEYIGSLTEQRVNQILAGMRFLQMSFFDR
jgi:mRNA interferase MazF